MTELISRQAAIEAWCKADCGCKREECHLTYERDGTDACAVVRFLQERPAIEPKHGECGISLEWINKHLEWLDSCDNEFAQLAKVSIKAMMELWKKELN